MSKERVLGIDLGAASVGSALIDLDSKRIVFAGVRIFEAGVDSLGSSKENSHGEARRLARSQRRQTDRRCRRKKQLLHLLQSHSLLPSGEHRQVLPELDRELSVRYGHPHCLPYVLRARAVDEALPLFEVGRAIYHLGQRRGFLSNRRVDRDEKETGVVKENIAGLAAEMEQAGARTLGEYFSKLNPHEHRVRGRHTSRKMYETEFELIWQKQAEANPEVFQSELKAQIHRAIFFQRPLKPMDKYVGECGLEPDEKRAPVALLQVQKVRWLGWVNNLRLRSPNEPERSLTAAERQAVVAEGFRKDSITLPHLRTKVLKLPSSVVFSLEQGMERKHPGVVTEVKLKKAAPEFWKSASFEDQCRLVEDLVTGSGTEEEMAEFLQGTYRLSETEATACVGCRLPKGYYSIGKTAITKLLPHLEKGLSYAEARDNAYPEQRQTNEPCDLLPPVIPAKGAPPHLRMPAVRNPIVIRALTEMRKVVNAIIREHGKPDIVRIELARDLKQNLDDRLEYAKSIRKREIERDEARYELKKLGIEASRRDIEKYLLWVECGKHCPYTGRPIGVEGLFGQNPQYDIEHIVPLSRSLDDSFANKTLCHREQNQLKANRTPWEAFGASDEWEQMVERVKSWKNPAKLRRFVMTESETSELLEKFSSRMLNDTRYASRLAAQYLGMLYGGTVADGRKRVFTTSGPITSWLRDEWGLNEPGSAGKSREDHRHHAVDAIVIALTNTVTVERLSSAAAEARANRRRRFGRLAPPWPELVEHVREKRSEIVVSLRPEYSLNSALHAETFYGKNTADKAGTVRYKRPWEKIDSIDSIADPHFRDIARAKLSEIGGQSVKDLAKDPPAIATPFGQVVMKKARVAENLEVTAIGESSRLRMVAADSIHHVEIVKSEGEKGTSYRHVPVTVLEAMRRYRAKVDVVKRDFGPGNEFVCSLRKGDLIDYKQRLLRVRSIWSTGQVVAHDIRDARKEADIRKQKGMSFKGVTAIFGEGARKVRVSPTGKVERAND
jgi:CRISPR-associated endonuclease Csn1